MNRSDDEIFADALELPDELRAAFLASACADAEQRARVERLLTGASLARDFLEQSPVERPAAPPEEKPGDVIDRYVLQRRLGEGGCGVVWAAEQTAPVRRPVALKIIKLGMDTREFVARFEAERQVLAMMDHPDIARVFDAGATARGRPYFVMELVDGLPITRFCDEHQLPTDARLELFVRVCQALQHAHQKGVIHRDIKPSNILVALHSGVPVPKIIDFGIAKATQGRLAERTLVTSVEQLLGTPAYMSPEQVEARDLDIDTRSDVYSLGALLYELLTGRLPYDPQSLVQAGLAEIRRIIREVDPPRPSARLATLAAADRDTVARQRAAAPVRLSTALRGELDWIVMRCLEKDRERRYGTTQELAADVQRYLRHEAVAARPPDAVYRARKFIARHRTACASAAALAFALVAGTVVSLQQAGRARRAETLARAERDTARAAQGAEALARADAQRRQEQAEALLSFMLGDFRAELKKIGKLNLLDAVGDKALAHFAALDPRDLTDAALTQQAKALTQIGEIRLDQARYADASAAFENAYRRAAALAARHPRNGDMLFERAQAEYWIGFTARRRGDFTAAREWLTRYRDSATALVALEGKTYRAQRELIAGEHNLAVLLIDQGALPEARRSFEEERRAVEALLETKPAELPLHFRLADIDSWLGRISEADGKYEEAIRYSAAHRQKLEWLLTQDPTVTRWKEGVADSCFFTAYRLLNLGRRAAAATQLEEAAAIFKSLCELDPKNLLWLSQSTNTALHGALLEWHVGDKAKASERLKHCLDEAESLVKAEPSSHIYVARLAAAWRSTALFRAADDTDSSLAAALKSLSLSEPIVRDSRASPWAVWEFAQANLIAARLELAREHKESAARHLANAIQLLAPRLAKSPDEWRLLDPLAQAYLLSGNDAAARPLVERLRSFDYHPLDPLAASLLGLPH